MGRHAGRHARPKGGRARTDGKPTGGGASKSRRIPAMAAAVLVPIGVAGWLWFAPASLIPLPKQTAVCTVTGGGTLRVHTMECGTVAYRGHIDLLAGQRVEVVSTGPVAWSVVSVEGSDG